MGVSLRIFSLGMSFKVLRFLGVARVLQTQEFYADGCAMVSARHIQAGVENGVKVEAGVNKKRNVSEEEYGAISAGFSSISWDLQAEQYKGDLPEVKLPPCKFFCAATPQGQTAIPMPQSTAAAPVTTPLAIQNGPPPAESPCTDAQWANVQKMVVPHSPEPPPTPFVFSVT